MSKKHETTSIDEMLEPKTNKNFVSTYDANKLRNLIKQGKTAKEIMAEFGLTHSQVLKHHLLKLCTTDQKYYEIPGLYQRRSRKAFVNAKGEIKLNMSNIDFNGITFPPETEFDVIVTNNQIVLTLISPSEPKPISDGEIDGDKTEDVQSL